MNALISIWDALLTLSFGEIKYNISEWFRNVVPYFNAAFTGVGILVLFFGVIVIIFLVFMISKR